MNLWTENKLPAEGKNPHSLPALSLTTVAISKPHREKRGKMMKVKCSMLIYLRTSQFCVQIEEIVPLKPLPHGWKISRRWKRFQTSLWSYQPMFSLIRLHHSCHMKALAQQCKMKTENMRQVALFFPPEFTQLCYKPVPYLNYWCKRETEEIHTRPTHQVYRD